MIDIRCKECFLRTYQRHFKKFNISTDKQLKFIAFYTDTMKNQSKLKSPEIQRILNKEFCQLIDIEDPFIEEKKQSNLIALNLYEKWQPLVCQSENPFRLALKLAIAGNIMDYGANPDFNVQETFGNILNVGFDIDHSDQLKKKIEEAQNILYLGDNAGEIVFDKLFIEVINHQKLVYAVKGGPVLNDVTMRDAEESGLNKIIRVVSNGYDAPSTLVEKSSEEFKKLFAEADLIISKGQGNLEGLLDIKDKTIFFLFVVKCDMIGELFGLKKGSFVVVNNQISDAKRKLYC